jgi:hypothetical protein
MRTGKFAVDMAAVVAAIVTGGHNWGLDFVLVPLAASVTHQLVELLGAQYVETQRDNARARQEELEKQHLSGPLSEWLAQWPATGGSAYERLQLALKRIPESVKQVEEAVAKKG